MNTEVDLAVLIPTLNRYQDLLKAVKSVRDVNKGVLIYICDQTRLSDNVNGSEIEEIKKMDGVLYFHVNFQSLTRARNFLVQKCTKKICVFIDDDIILWPTFFDKIVKYLADENTCGVTGPSPRPDQGILSKLDIPDYEKKIKDGWLLNNVNFDHNPRWMAGCNHAFRKEDIVLVGGYDEIFYGPIGEDVEMSIRLQKKTQKKLCYSTSMGLNHNQTPSGGCRNSKNLIKKEAIRFADSLYQILRCEPYNFGLYFQRVRLFLLNKNLFKRPVTTICSSLFGLTLFSNMVLLLWLGRNKGKFTKEPLS